METPKAETPTGAPADAGGHDDPPRMRDFPIVRHITCFNLAPLAVLAVVVCLGTVLGSELTIGYGFLFEDRGVFAPIADEDPVNRLIRFTFPLVIGLAAALVTSVLLARRLRRGLRDFTADVQSLVRGDIGASEVRYPTSGVADGELVNLCAEIERMQASERVFLLGISHELRTPIAAIRGQASALEDGLFDDGDRDTAYGVIVSEADRLERLVGDLMDLARMRTNRFALARDEINPGELLAEAAQSVALSARRAGVEVRVGHDGLMTIIGDGDRLLQVIGNLLRNAIRWTPRGGCVDLHARIDHDAFEVVVDDSGAGIPVAERERVFEMFYSSSGTGSGMGLTIARDLVRAMDGDIRIGTSPAGGARFAVRVPRAVSSDHTDVPIIGPTPSRSGRSSASDASASGSQRTARSGGR